jgi:hypothetical protein
MKHVSISPEEAADRLAIRELVEAYAHCADRRDAKGQMSLFTADTHFVVFMNAIDPKPSQELHSREALAPAFADLNKYDATTHFVGQSTIFALTANQATGEAYCLAHHVAVDRGKRRLMVASLRYLDTFVKVDGAWLFAERLLYVDWVDERTVMNASRRARYVLSSWAPLEWSADMPCATRSTIPPSKSSRLSAAGSSIFPIPSSKRFCIETLRIAPPSQSRCQIRTRRFFAWASIPARSPTRSSGRSRSTIRSSSPAFSAPAAPARPSHS